MDGLDGWKAMEWNGEMKWIELYVILDCDCAMGVMLGYYLLGAT